MSQSPGTCSTLHHQHSLLTAQHLNLSTHSNTCLCYTELREDRIRSVLLAADSLGLGHCQGEWECFDRVALCPHLVLQPSWWWGELLHIFSVKSLLLRLARVGFCCSQQGTLMRHLPWEMVTAFWSNQTRAVDSVKSWCSPPVLLERLPQKHRWLGPLRDQETPGTYRWGNGHLWVLSFQHFFSFFLHTDPMPLQWLSYCPFCPYFMIYSCAK